MNKPVHMLLQITPITVFTPSPFTNLKNNLLKWFLMQTRLCDSKTCTKILRKFWGEGMKTAEDLRGGKTPTSGVPACSQKNGSQTREKTF